eukprot:TRINITY_DN3739_c0_g1_i6.p1 TRINITY_DN3739_c0_g1~~TRINITY_DN3739_c0_g1_i6.p1  ORF type:complete len:610 (+),score=146.47 TRINITY_DN3739_c0_g1_i6:235-2064(+)
MVVTNAVGITVLVVAMEVVTWVDWLYRFVTAFKMCWVVCISVLLVMNNIVVANWEFNSSLLTVIFFASGLASLVMLLQYPYGLCATVITLSIDSVLMGALCSIHVGTFVITVVEVFAVNMMVEGIYLASSEISKRQIWAFTDKLRQENDQIMKHLTEIATPITEALDLESPIQKVIAVLQRLKQMTEVEGGFDSNTTNHEFYLQLLFCISLLGKENLFQPDLHEQVSTGHMSLDPETTDWLFSEVAVRQTMAIIPPSASSFILPTEGELVPRISDDEQLEVSSVCDTQTWGGLDEWGADMFALAQQHSGERPSLLARVTTHALRAHCLATLRKARRSGGTDTGSDSGISGSGSCLERFLEDVNTTYHDNFYHNAVHAADVVQTLHCVLNMGLDRWLNELELFSLLIAGACHDADHPGVNNNFLINTESPLAVKYNDRSVLENHHAATAIRLLAKHKLLESFTEEERKAVRKNVIETIVATDMACHLDWVSKFKMRVGSNFCQPEDRLLLMVMALKCADISNVCKPPAVYKKWTDALVQECYAQGDLEKKRGIRVSPFMDRNKPESFANSQRGFFKILAEPMFTAFAKFLGNDKASVIAQNMHANMAQWC